tara:strand:+ start:11112 stop:12131 length:1020 start_codon:yes stop_codon:yes gene_type:complete
MKALLSTDLHLLPNQIELSKRVLEMIKVNSYKYLTPGEDKIILPGDIFHFKNTIHTNVQKLFEKFLLEMSKDFQVIVLVGNHDWGIPYKTHSLQAYKNLNENIIIVDDIYRDGKHGFIPYYREKELFHEKLKELGDIEYLYGHLDINGFQIGSGWEEYSEDFSSVEDFKKYKKVISGHLHLAQEKVVEGTEYIYIGTAYTTSFSETDQKKRFIIMDMDTGEWEEYDTGLTLHKTIEINASEELPEIPKEDLDKGVSYRVIITGTREEIDQRIDLKNQKYPARINYNFINKERTRIELKTTDTVEETINKFTEKQLKRVYDENHNFDINKLLKIGKKYAK